MKFGREFFFNHFYITPMICMWNEWPHNFGGSGTTLAGRTGNRKHRASRVTCSCHGQRTARPFLRYRPILRVKKGRTSRESSAHWFVQFSFLFINLWVKQGIDTSVHVPNRILCRAADLNQQPAREKGVGSDYNRTAQPLQIPVPQCAKSWEIISGMIDDSESMTTKVKNL